MIIDRYNISKLIDGLGMTATESQVSELFEAFIRSNPKASPFVLSKAWNKSKLVRMDCVESKTIQDIKTHWAYKGE